MLSAETHNKKSLAERYRIPQSKLSKWLDSLLRDIEVKKKFGEYSGQQFTPKQLDLIEHEWGSPPPRATVK